MKRSEELRRLSKMKKLTRKQWERLQELEEIEEEKLEKKWEKLSDTMPVKDRLRHTRRVFESFGTVLIINKKRITVEQLEELKNKTKDKELFLGLSTIIYALFGCFVHQIKLEDLFDKKELAYLKNTLDYIQGKYEEPITIRPNPKDIGKKNYVCERCGWTSAWIKIKPIQCKRCGNKKIKRYFRF